MIIKYNINIFKYICFIFLSFTFSFPVYSELSVEELIKGRKALFSKNYSTAKQVQALSSKGNFEDARKLMIEMSNNYKNLLNTNLIMQMNKLYKNKLLKFNYEL